MDSLADLPRRYDAERWRRGFDALPRFGDRGLTLGRGTVLARMEAGTICLDGDRLAALLLVAHGRAVPLSVVKHARRAAKYWRRGEAALAHIELAFARLPRLQAEDDAFSLFLSELLLDDGLAPHDLAQALGVVLAKYDPDQPRVPAGNGRERGRWGPGSGAAGTARVAEMTPIVVRLFLADAARCQSALKLSAAQRWLGFEGRVIWNCGGFGLSPLNQLVLSSHLVPDDGVMVLSEVDDRLMMMAGCDASSTAAKCGPAAFSRNTEVIPLPSRQGHRPGSASKVLQTMT